jgi:hypothetical protein
MGLVAICVLGSALSVRKWLRVENGARYKIDSTDRR